jgi:hypothetical protein
MRLLSLVTSLALAVALLPSFVAATPAAPAQPTVLAAPADTDSGNGNGTVKKDPDRSYRARLEARSTPKHGQKPGKKPKYKPWAEATKDATKSEGLFTVYTKDENVLFAIKEDQLDKPFVEFMSLSKGIGTRFVLGGLPITGSVMFDFHRVEDHVQIRMLNTLFRAPDDKALEESIDLSYGNSVMFSLPIESENEKDKLLLLDMNDVFLSDVSDMGFFLQLALQKPVRLDQKKAVYRKVKAFPKNVEVEALLTYSPGDRRGLDLPQVPDSRYIEIGVHYSLHMLPENPMKPRIADDRVGYFTTPYKDFSKDNNESFFVYYINRWRLEKKDPNAAVSDPVQPIVFYLDPTIPEKYRPYVAQGIEMWQKAFEKAGFSNAIIAKEVGDDPDYDAEDARYNTIRWIVSDEPSFGAIGPSRVDPRTGEILDADILIEQSMISSFRKSYRRYAGPEALMNIDPTLRYLQDPKLHPELAAEIEMRKHFGGSMCDIGDGFALNFDFAGLAILAEGEGSGMDVPIEFIGQALKWVTVHEVGHTLGLRHNFKSSISTPYDELQDKEAIDEIGMTGSVMDYASPNVARDRSKQGYYYSPVVGTCDDWVIQYGYTELPGNHTAAEEAKLLRPIADEASQKDHAYGTDEDTYPAGALDPYASIWDLSDDPLAWAKERIGVCHDILEKGDLEKRVVSKGDNFVPLRNAATTVLIQEYIATARAIKYVGGQYTARPHRGDNSGEMPFMPVPADKQRDAMNFVIANGFSRNAFALPPSILNKLADDKNWDWQNNLFEFGRRFDYPMVGWVGGLQHALLAQLLQPMLLQRMVDAQYKSEKPYRLAELFSSLTDAIWMNNIVPSGQTAVMQRNLQRDYLNYIVDMTVSPSPYVPKEAVALARLQLDRLQTKIKQAYGQKGLSDEANAHLLESASRIDRALNAKLESTF